MNAATPTSAPGIPPDYYERIHAFERSHFWFRGMRAVAEALLGDALPRGGRLLDAGCGTGGFLEWARDRGPFFRLGGVDVGSRPIELARERVPEAELHVAPLSRLPFDDASFDLVVTNDVLQHVHEDDVAESVRELRRVVAPGGTLLVRTNGARMLRRERDDWRAYDRRTLVAELARGGFRCERATYANVALSAWAELRGRRPHAPSETRDGVPDAAPGRLRGAVGSALLTVEARALRLPHVAFPFGHTLFVLARPVE